MIWTKVGLDLLLTNIFLSLIDILLISYLFYKFYQIIAQTKAIQVIKGLMFFISIYIFSRFIKLQTFQWLIDQIAGVVVIAIIVVFQPEVRRILTKIGQSNLMNIILKKDLKDLEQVLQAIENFHILQIGALIVFERNVGLKNIIETGTLINSKISASLIMTIFTYKTPLHDGALIIKNDQIVAAGCFLPLSESTQISKNFGTRHRAALGLAEESDAVIVVVSEETGRISLAYDGKLYTNYDLEILRKELIELLGYENSDIEDINNEKSY